MPSRSIFLPYSNYVTPSSEPRCFSGRPLRLGHAPSNRSIKGSQYVLDAFRSLEQEGYDVEFILVENMSHTEALNQYRNIDIFVDQLLIGWYGGVSVEAMSQGSIVLANIDHLTNECIPIDFKSSLPIIHVTPNNLLSELKKLLLSDSGLLSSFSSKSLSFVQNHHNSDLILKNFILPELSEK